MRNVADTHNSDHGSEDELVLVFHLLAAGWYVCRNGGSETAKNPSVLFWASNGWLNLFKAH